MTLVSNKPPPPPLKCLLITPKLKKIKKKIVLSISKLCKIDKNKINLKGKTAEKLGVIGKEKAIACEVITSIQKKYD